MHMIMNNLDPAVAQVIARETEAQGPGLSNRIVPWDTHVMCLSFLFGSNDRFPVTIAQHQHQDTNIGIVEIHVILNFPIATWKSKKEKI